MTDIVTSLILDLLKTTLEIIWTIYTRPSGSGPLTLHVGRATHQFSQAPNLTLILWLTDISREILFQPGWGFTPLLNFS